LIQRLIEPRYQTGSAIANSSSSDAALQTCLALKVLFGMPLRQTNGFAQIFLRLAGLDWAVPDITTLCRR